MKGSNLIHLLKLLLIKQYIYDIYISRMNSVKNFIILNVKVEVLIPELVNSVESVNSVRYREAIKNKGSLWLTRRYSPVGPV